jgi:hypothetical protein
MIVAPCAGLSVSGPQLAKKRGGDQGFVLFNPGRGRGEDYFCRQGAEKEESAKI